MHEPGLTPEVASALLSERQLLSVCEPQALLLRALYRESLDRDALSLAASDELRRHYEAMSSSGNVPGESITRASQSVSLPCVSECWKITNDIKRNLVTLKLMISPSMAAFQQPGFRRCRISGATSRSWVTSPRAMDLAILPPPVILMGATEEQTEVAPTVQMKAPFLQASQVLLHPRMKPAGALMYCITSAYCSATLAVSVCAPVDRLLLLILVVKLPGNGWTSPQDYRWRHFNMRSMVDRESRPRHKCCSKYCYILYFMQEIGRQLLIALYRMGLDRRVHEGLHLELQYAREALVEAWAASDIISWVPSRDLIATQLAALGSTPSATMHVFRGFIRGRRNNGEAIGLSQASALVLARKILQVGSQAEYQ